MPKNENPRAFTPAEDDTCGICVHALGDIQAQEAILASEFERYAQQRQQVPTALTAQKRFLEGRRATIVGELSAAQKSITG